MNYPSIWLSIFCTAYLCVFAWSKPSLDLVYQRQVDLLIECIETLNSLNKFDNIILYRTPNKFYEAPVDYSRLLHDQSRSHKTVGDKIMEYIFTSQLHKPIMAFTIEPWHYVNDTKRIPNLGSFLTNRNLVVVVFHDINHDDVKEFVSNSLGVSRETKLVFLLIGLELADAFPFVRVAKLTKFFHWCWSKNLLNVILLFQKDNVINLKDLSLEMYAYTPFPKPVKLIQLTGKPASNYFMDRITNLNGYEFKTPVFNDKPSVFKAFDFRRGVVRVTGISGRLYVEFVKKINGTFTEIYSDPNVTNRMNYQHNLLTARRIDIGIHPFSSIVPNSYYGSYPISYTNGCLVVPVVPEIFPGLYIPRTLNRNMWFSLPFLFVIFQITYYIIDKHTYGQWKPWCTMSLTLRGMLNMPLGNSNSVVCHLSSKRKLLIHLLVILIGMMYCTMYTAALTSFLSTTLYGKQLDTLEDLQKANIPIMALDFFVDAYNYLDLIPEQFNSNIIIADVETVSNHVNSFNTSYAYIVYYEEWKVMQNLQRNLWKPHFKIAPDLCMPNMYLSLPMQFNSPFYHPLKMFFLRMQETGLEQKWSDNMLWDLRQTTRGPLTFTENQEHPVALKLTHYTVIWCIYGVGMVLALIVFLYELKFKARLKF